VNFIYDDVTVTDTLACFLQNVVVLRCIYYWMTLLLPCRTAVPTSTIKIGRAVTLCPNCALRGPHTKTIKMILIFNRARKSLRETCHRQSNHASALWESQRTRQLFSTSLLPLLCVRFFNLRSKRIMTQKDSYRCKRTNMTERQNVRV